MFLDDVMVFFMFEIKYFMVGGILELCCDVIFFDLNV